MNCNVKLNGTLRKRSPRLNGCALLAILILSVGLTSCSHVSSVDRGSLPLYQPRVLRLEQGKPVQTKDGVHTPAEDEVWHSDTAYRLLERQNVNLAAALAQYQGGPK